jgi:hypothetical protein
VLPTVDPDTEMSWFVFVPRLGVPFSREERDEMIAGLRNHDIGAAITSRASTRCRLSGRCLDRRRRSRSRSRSEGGRSRCRSIGGLTEREVDLVVQTLEVLLGRQVRLGR